MKYDDVRSTLLSMFSPEKLEPSGEWGFLNETGSDVRKIGYATNLTPETILEAAKYGVDFMITHHDAWDFVYGMKETCVRLLEEHSITHAYVHAPLDDASFGTSATLAQALNLCHCHKTMPYEGVYQAAVIGELPDPVPFEKLAAALTGILGEPVRAYRNNDRKISRVCVVTGGGNMTNDMKYAVEEGCDAYITGEYMLYSQLYARFAGMNFFVGSHTYTEILGVKSFVERLVAGTDMTAVRLFEENY